MSTTAATPEGDSAARPSAPRLPRGLPLPEQSWRNRHRAVLVALTLLLALVVVWSVSSADWEILALGALPAALAGLLAVRAGVGHRSTAAALTVSGALWASAAVVELSHGDPEAHFLFFLVVAGATLYQAWAPFAVCAAFVAGYHLVLGSARPELLHATSSSVSDPWVWSGVHAGLLTLAGLIGIAVWNADERVRSELSAMAARDELLMEAMGDGLVAVDPAGRVVQVNPAARALLGRPWEPLVGQDVRGLLHGVDEAMLELTHPIGVVAPVRHRRWAAETATAVPVEVTVVETREDGDIAAVLTVRDLTNEVRAEEAERRLASAVEREATQRRDVSGLQAAMRPDALSATGIEIGVIYEPAESSPAGGDLYDWFALPDGTVQVTVVDAMGRGLGATRQALAVTATLRTLTLSGVPLAEVIARADDVLSRMDPELVATVAIVRYDPATGAAEVVSGGHPPVLHVRDGEGVYIEVEGVPIGYPQAGSLGVGRFTVAEGDLVLLYSDGIVEGTRDLGAGLDTLAKAASDLSGLAPQEVAERLLAELPTVAHAEDDCLLLALTRTPAGAGRSGGAADRYDDLEAELTLPPELTSARLVRRHATSFAEAHHLDPQVTDALVLVVSELAANAIAHADTPFRVRLRVVDGQVRGTVSDSSTRLPVVRPGRADGVSGRGLIIVDRLARAWGVNAGPEDLGKTVWFTLSVTPPTPADEG